MKSKFYPAITDQVIADYNLSRGNSEQIFIGDEDISTALAGSKSAAILVGKGNGENRVDEAFQDAISQMMTIALGYELKDIKSAVYKLSYKSDSDLLMDELAIMPEIFNQFTSDSSVIWGVRSHEEGDDMYIYILMGM